MVTSVLLILLLLFNLISEGRNHVGQPCNKIFRICLSSNSYCDKENICRCKPDYPVNISLHSCKKGKQYSEKCEYSEECYYYDPNSYCSQLPYRSTCECHTGFTFNEVTRVCESSQHHHQIVTREPVDQTNIFNAARNVVRIKGFFDNLFRKPSWSSNSTNPVGKEPPKTSNVVFPTAIGGTLAFASIIFFCLVAWQVCKRRGVSIRSRYQSACLESSGPVPSAPTADETLPTYDTALSLKISEDCEPPPSYEEVISQAEEAQNATSKA